MTDAVTPGTGGRTKDRPGLRLLVLQFERTVAGIRDIVELAAPHLADGLSAELREVRKRMSPDQRQTVSVMLAVTRHGSRSEEDAPRPEDDEAAIAKALATPDWEALRARAEARELTAAEANTLVRRFFSTPEGRTLFGLFLQRWQERLLTPEKVYLLNEAMLVTAVAAFETLLAGVFTQQLVSFPKLLERDEPKLSLTDLLAFDSLEDAREAILEDHVDTFMRASLEKWQSWLDKRAGIQISDLAMDFDVFREALLRRNVVVHNAGRASRQYLSLAPKTAAELKVGDRLRISSEYLERALDELTVVGVGLGAIAWSQWFKDEHAVSFRELQTIVFRLLETRRYQACRKLAELATLPGGAWDHEAMRVNAWIAQKAQEGVEAIRADVTAWDISAASPVFRLARAALLDELDEVFELLPSLIERDEVTTVNLATWPLFESAREDPRFEQLTQAQPEPESPGDAPRDASASGEDQNGGGRE